MDESVRTVDLLQPNTLVSLHKMCYDTARWIIPLILEVIRGRDHTANMIPEAGFRLRLTFSSVYRQIRMKTKLATFNA